MLPSAAQLRSLRRRDPVLAPAMRRVAPFPGFPAPGAADSHFHSLAKAIVHQQLALPAARTIHSRVRSLTPGPRFPKPEEVLELPLEDLRAAGLSGSKAAALQDLSSKTLDGTLRLRGLGRLADEEVIERLVQVRGIGEWTAHMFLLFRLGRLDVMAPADLGLQQGMKVLDGLADRPTPGQLAERAEDWRPLRSVASWVLWRLLD